MLRTQSTKMKYIKLLALSKEAVETVKRPFKKRRMSKQSLSIINDLEEEEAVLEEEYKEAQAEYPIDFDKLMLMKNKIALAVRKQGQMKEIRKELF